MSREIKTVQDIYAAVDILVTELASQNLVELANKLSFRVHEVAWTSGSELLEELQEVINDALCVGNLPPSIETDVKNILRAIEDVLAFVRRSRSSVKYPNPVLPHTRGVLVEWKKKKK